jgi:hypothetical protein
VRKSVKGETAQPGQAGAKKEKKTYICGMKILTTTYQKEIAFTLSCYDRLILTGNLPEISYVSGMTSYLHGKEVKIFDFQQSEKIYQKVTSIWKNTLSLRR